MIGRDLRAVFSALPAQLRHVRIAHSKYVTQTAIISLTLDIASMGTGLTVCVNHMCAFFLP